MKRNALASVAIAILVIASSAAAHHSGSMYESNKVVALTGTVRLFQFTNPHCFIQLVVPDSSGNGKAVEWSIGMGAPAHMFRSGWKPTTLKVGDAINVTFKPMRDGSAAGLFVSATWPDGKPVVVTP